MIIDSNEANKIASWCERKARKKLDPRRKVGPIDSAFARVEGQRLEEIARALRRREPLEVE